MENKKNQKAMLITMTAPESAEAEAYRTLRTNISMKEFDKPVEVINVISANAKEGKSTTVLNLAYVYAQLGKKILVIDLDLRLPSIHKKIGVKNKIGITDVLSKKANLKDAIVHYAANMDVLLSGTKTPYTSEFIQSEALKDFLKSMREIYDVIIIDCPPVNLVTDGVIASAYCDGTIFCVASGYDDRRDLEHAKEVLNNAKVNVIGTVLTRMPMTKRYYKSGYNYGYGYGQNTARKPK